MAEPEHTRNDRIVGTEDPDQIFGDGPVTLSEGKTGNDEIFGLGGTRQYGGKVPQPLGDRLYGDTALLDGHARGGNDFIDAGAGDDLVVGDAMNMAGEARGGNDLLLGGPGPGEIFGDAEGMADNSRGGNDVIIGGSDGDSLSGDARVLYANARGGNDRLDGGGPANDYLIGDGTIVENASGGQDTFVFRGVFGNDSVVDFRQGEDHLEIDVPGIDGIEDLVIEQVPRFVEGAPFDTMIAVEGFGTVRLIYFEGTLAEADFVFV